jgi:hypothetical protein
MVADGEILGQTGTAKLHRANLFNNLFKFGMLRFWAHSEVTSHRVV